MNRVHLKMSFLLLPLMFLITACPSPYKYNNVHFPESPVNMDSVNSEYDDYNANMPFLGGDWPLYFSSNRNSKGGEYDIVYYVLNIQYDRKENQLYIGPKRADTWDNYQILKNLQYALTKINTSYNEYGPYVISWDNFSGEWKDNDRFLFFFANDTAGNLDIKFVNNFGWHDRFTDPFIAWALNSSADDAYPCFSYLTNDFYFSSNRDGNFDIFKLHINDLTNVISILTDSNNSNFVVKDTSLSTSSNDKFPFIDADVMVFASDRPGGYGGYDLYYSVLKDSIWRTPVNLGAKINTQFDECRPILIQRGVFDNSLIIFSSNRPGGKGGFDLYYAGIPKYGKTR